MSKREDWEASILAIAAAEVGSEDWRRYVLPVWLGWTGTVAPSWCQVFCLWVWRRAGLLPNHIWVQTKGITPALPIVSVAAALPGDMLYMSKNNHGALLQRRELVDGETWLFTIDGNTVGDLNDDGKIDSWSCVSVRRRRASEWESARSVHAAIDSALGVSLTRPTILSVARAASPAWAPIQKDLRAGGYYAGNIDGDPGKMTCQAILNAWLDTRGVGVRGN